MEGDVHLHLCFCLLLREGDKASADWLPGTSVCAAYLHGLRLATQNLHGEEEDGQNWEGLEKTDQLVRLGSIRAGCHCCTKV